MRRQRGMPHVYAATTDHGCFFLLSMNKPNTGSSIFRVAASAGNSILAAGRHIVQIMSITPDAAIADQEVVPWKDDTPQAKVLFKNKDGIFTEWLNLKAFKRFSELSAKDKASGKYVGVTHPEFPGEEYAMNKKTGHRVEDPERTATCMGIIGQLANAAGFEVDEEVTEDDLQGKTVGIVVKENANGKLRARSFFRVNPAKKVLETA